ncbi:hypothetical protein ASZ78_003173 [Callipepla squamata]|uniref:Uncharacterized protein n=1 Tax=Callipepla squamata TaxID=9009 RepID=A0A226MHB7_CALSU|nr:hypothetical protein ASZ78_003173 [Callipepla squamata]
MTHSESETPEGLLQKRKQRKAPEAMQGKHIWSKHPIVLSIRLEDSSCTRAGRSRALFSLTICHDMRTNIVQPATHSYSSVLHSIPTLSSGNAQQSQEGQGPAAGRCSKGAQKFTHLQITCPFLDHENAYFPLERNFLKKKINSTVEHEPMESFAQPEQNGTGMAVFSGRVHGRWRLGTKRPRFKDPLISPDGTSKTEMFSFFLSCSAFILLPELASVILVANLPAQLYILQTENSPLQPLKLRLD